MWDKYFTDTQGHTASHNIIYQDNKSIILLAINGFTSSGKKMKYIHQRYFFVKDPAKKGN